MQQIKPVEPIIVGPYDRQVPTCPFLPAATTATCFSVDAGDPLMTHYYVVFRVNGTMQKGEYQIQVAEDGLLVLFVCAIPSRSFDKKILKKIYS